MTISNLFIRLIVLILPGIISCMLFRKLVGRVIKTKWEEFCEIIVFSLTIYIVFAIVVKIFCCIGWLGYKVTFFDTLLDEKATIVWYEILVASLIALPVAFVASYIHSNKLINKFGRIMRVTRKFGDQDVWDFFHNLPEKPEYEWVYVRDHKTNLAYFGFIHAYSDSEKERELLMGDVDVYTNDKGEFLYKSKMLYLCRHRYEITIELPAIEEEIKAGDQIKFKETSNVKGK